MKVTLSAGAPGADVRQYSLTIDYIDGQGWEAHFEGEDPTLDTGGFGFEAQTPGELMTCVARALALDTQGEGAAPS